MTQEKRDDYFKPKTGKLNAIIGLLTFFTIIPIKWYTTIEDMAKMAWFTPFIGLLVGTIGIILSYLLYTILHLPALLVACLIYAFFTLINGCHHLDGLLDFSDAIMFQGTAEKKLEIMRDPITGTGALASLFLVGITTIACFYTIITTNLLFLILISEISGKIGLITTCISSKAAPNGTGKEFIEYLSFPTYLISIIICIILSYILNPQFGIFGILGGILGGAIISYISMKHFKIATGDVLGASNEISRLISLIIMIIAITI